MKEKATLYIFAALPPPQITSYILGAGGKDDSKMVCKTSSSGFGKEAASVVVSRVSFRIQT